jgi:peptide/nickel transport system substrate-binding protein
VKKILLLSVLIFSLSIGVSAAKTLKIGLSSDIRSLDPYFHNETTTNSVLSNVFEPLFYFDKDLNVYPVLCESYKILNDKEWIFKLRKGVKFHNGDVFNADDVIYSLDRIMHWKKSGFKSKVNMIADVQKIDDYTVKITTKGPYPILLRKLTYVRILDKEFYQDKTPEYLSLHANGTGPYKVVKWNKGEKIELEMNKDYWRDKPYFDKVIFRPLTNDSTRVAAILSGEVDIIDKVPVRDVARIKGNKKLDFFIKPGLRLIYLQMDQGRDKTPYVKGKNPFKDVRVRKAIYYGINEDAIVKYVMNGFAKPAGQYHPDVVFGYDKSIKRPAYNPEKAKKLLAEAGYPNGFEVVLDAPNDRYVNDEQIAQAIASSLSKIGIKVKVNAIPKATFFPKTDRLDTSFFLIGWASSDGDGSSFLDGIVHTYDTEKGYGRYNRGRYSNAKVDALIEKAGVTLDKNERLQYMIEAQKIALIEEQNVIPLHLQVDLYASRKAVSFTPRTDSHMYVYDIKMK